MKHLTFLLVPVLLFAAASFGGAQQVSSQKSDAEKIGEAMAKVHELFQGMIAPHPEAPRAAPGGAVAGPSGGMIPALGWGVRVPKETLSAVYVEAAKILDSLTTSLTNYELKEFKISVSVPPSLDVTFVPKGKRVP